LYDGNNAYNLTFSIAKLNDGTYVAYAKRNLAKDTDLLNKIKKEAPTSKSRGVLPYTNTISQSNKNVKSDKVSTKYSIQENTNNTQELNNSSFSLEETETIMREKIDQYLKEIAELVYVNDIETYEGLKSKRSFRKMRGELATDYGIDLIANDDLFQKIYKELDDKYKNRIEDKSKKSKEDIKKLSLDTIINDKIHEFENDGFVEYGSDNYNAMMDEIHEMFKTKNGRELTEEDYETIDDKMNKFYDLEVEGYVSNSTKNSNSKAQLDIMKKINDSSDFIKNNEYIKEQVGYLESNIDKDLAIKDIEKALPDLIKINDFIDNLSKLTDIKHIDTSKKSISTYIDINAEALKNKTLQEFLIKNGYDSYDLKDFLKHGNLDGNLTIRISNHEVGGRYDMMNDQQIDYSGGDINLFLNNIEDLSENTKDSRQSITPKPTWQKFLDDNYKATGIPMHY